jgi:hypothetical protein
MWLPKRVLGRRISEVGRVIPNAPVGLEMRPDAKMRATSLRRVTDNPPYPRSVFRARTFLMHRPGAPTAGRLSKNVSALLAYFTSTGNGTNVSTPSRFTCAHTT